MIGPQDGTLFETSLVFRVTIPKNENVEISKSASNYLKFSRIVRKGWTLLFLKF